ncbi:hypothetical protein DICVIV_00248 [Dictyocaulus viviparus]|uniref:Cep192/Spd-2-like domain-containing protein n=1 Tax=Dictyocaulus viviparus TaxID=29172 RepID=A0A0D8Y9S6_DICVI|nr:hypothetical protein DICVIV_00248 [Dictyocaulus viviparus]
MGSVVDDNEIVEDRFDDQSFVDAPLSDHESNFDEMELRDCDNDQLHQPIDQIYSQNNWIRPALSTIPEESKIDDIPSSEITNRSSISRQPSEGSISNVEECASIKAYSIKSSEFITDKKASEIIEREQESFFRGHGRFIQDDPRFNMSHFEKENSWEPSILDYSSFDSTVGIAEELPVLKGNGDHGRKSNQQSSFANMNKDVEQDESAVRTTRYTENTGRKEVSGTTGKRNNLEGKEMDKSALNHLRVTPKRILNSSLPMNDSTNQSESCTNGVQTSTPVSLNANASSKIRCHELVEKFQGVSMIMPEGDSANRDMSLVDEHSIAETTTTTTFSVGSIRDLLKDMPASSSPRTLMKVLDDYKRNRVRAKKIESHLLPIPTVREIKTSYTSRNYPSTKQSSSAAETMNQTKKADKSHYYDCEATSKTSGIIQDAIKGQHRDSGKVSKTSEGVPHTAVRDNERKQEVPKKEKDNVAGRQPAKAEFEEAVCFFFPFLGFCVMGLKNRPHSSARSTSSLSTIANDRCSSKMSSDTAQRSVLYIPQHEVAFGFVAIGDTAVSNVDVTNRTDNSLRIRAKLSHTGPPFALLDSQILLLDPRRTVSLRIEFSPTQNARFCTNLLIAVEGGGGPQMNYRMPIRGLGGTAIVTVKARDDLRLSRNGTYILQSCYESTFSFALTNSGNRRAFSRIIVLYMTESGALEPVPVEIRPAPGIVIDRAKGRFLPLLYNVSIRLQCSLPNSDWKSSQSSLVSTASTTQQRAVSKLQVLVYWGEERTRLRLRCFEKLRGISHLCDGIHFTDAFVGEDLSFCPPEDHPISKEDMRLFDQTLRMCTIYVCSTRIRPRPSLISNTSSFDRSLQPEDTFREKSTYKVAVADQTLR